MKVIEQKLHIRRRPEGTTMQRLIRSVQSGDCAWRRGHCNLPLEPVR